MGEKFAVAARFRRRLGAHLRGVIAAALLWATASHSLALSDSDLKIAYLFNFASLVGWPSSSLSGDAPIIIGFVGGDGMADQLERRVGNRTAKGHPIEVRRISPGDYAAMRACQVLYVGEGQRSRFETILHELEGAPVLTVSDASDFARRGGIIAFETEDKTVRFVANARMAKSSGLALGSDVLRLAREVISR